MMIMTMVIIMGGKSRRHSGHQVGRAWVIFHAFLIPFPSPFKKVKASVVLSLYNTPATSAAFFPGVVSPYRALAASLTGALCFVVEQVCGFDGHVHDI